MTHRVSLFVTCIVDQLFPNVGMAMAEVLERAGCDVNFPEAQTCCGQPAFNSGFRSEARDVARHFLSVFSKAEYVVVPSGSCTSMITHHFEDIFQKEPASLEASRALAPKVWEFSNFLLEVAGVDDVGAELHEIVTYHDSCHALRELKIKQGPRRLLSHVRGLELREMDIAEECCGFGGTFSVKFDELSGAMARTKIDSVVRTGASTVISIDSSCLMQLRGALSRADLPIRTMHLAEVLASRYPAPMSAAFDQKIHDTIANPELQLAIYTATARLIEKRRKTVDDDHLPEYQDLRDQANAVKTHTIENLDYYLEQFERQVTAHGGRVIYCRDGNDVADFVLGLAKERQARLIVKSKSMTTEEIDFNERLEHHGLESVETDLGEYIIQLAHIRPYHIIAPALQMTRFDVARIFTEKLGVDNETVIEKQAGIARSVLREKFLAADIGVSGANFLIADSGAIVLVENEGNARLTTSAPRIHIAVAGIEKLIPRAQDLATFLKLLGRSATGQPLTVYTSFLSGPRRQGEIDGPDEFYVVLIDNGRTKLLADREKRESLNCIRCGACLNICPVYRRIGGHSFPWVYSGPIGAILTPQFMGPLHEPALPFASSLCGACAEVCPVKIDIPKILLALRVDVKKAQARDSQGRLERLAYRLWAWVMRHPRIYEMAGMAAASLAPDGNNGYIRTIPAYLNVGPIRGWSSQRDLPAPAPKTFRQMWRARTKP